MKRFSEQFNKKSKTVALQAFEREELRNRVVSYMEYHPLPVAMQKESRVRVVGTQQPYQMVRIPMSLLMKWSAIVSVIALVIVPFLAEKAVPGDTLYAIKVEFNEEVRSTLTLSPYKKVEWETERLNRRIAEARLLASEGRLTNEVEAEMAEAVREHTESVQHEIEVLRETDADEATLASIELSTTLAMQSSSLQEEGETTLAMAISDVSYENSTQMLVDVINESLSKQESQFASSTIPAYEKIMARVELNTTRAYELLNSLGINQEEKLYADISRRLEDINRSIEKANGLRSDNEVAASEHLVAALQRTQKLIVFMSDAEVGKVADIETVVPMILTEQEEKQRLEQLTIEINRKVEILTAILPQLSIGATEKIDYTLDLIAQSVESSTSSEVVRTLPVAKEQVVLLNDALKLATDEGVDFTGATAPVVVPVQDGAETGTSTQNKPSDNSSPQ